MRILRALAISLLTILTLLLCAPMTNGQDLSKYRTFSFGMSLAEVSKQLDSQPLQTKLVQKRPAIIQEVTWWPRRSSDTALQAEPVWQVLFTFYNGELYRILVTYDRHATEGLTTEDMVEALSAKYGTATRPDADISFPTNELYRSTEKVIARWEDSQDSLNLFRSSYLNTFGLVMFSKRLDAEVRVAIAQSIKMEGQQDSSQQETARQKQEAENLEASRQQHKKTFHP